MRKEDREKIVKTHSFLDLKKNQETEDLQKYERVSEAAPEGMTWEGLPEGIQDTIDNAIYDFCNYECKPPVANLADARQPLWSACCQYIGNTVYKRYKLLRRGRGDREPDGRWIPYDENVLLDSIPIWLLYCRKFSKAPFASDFWEFVGASYDWIYNYRAVEVSPIRTEIMKKLKNVQEAGLAGLIADGRGNPTGAIAILNHWHGWNQAPQNDIKQVQNAISVNDLPRLGAISGENGNPNGNQNDTTQ